MSGFDENIDFESDLMYDGGNRMSGGIEMTSREAINAALKAMGKTQAEAAAKMGWVPQQLNSRLVRGSFRADEFLKVLDAIGIDVKLTVRETGEEVRANIAGAGRRVRSMVDRVIYDTSASDALANNFYEDGVNEYGPDGTATELYMDREGRYFFAEYTNVEGRKDRIIAAPGSVAAAFIEKYGTELHRGPTEQD